ncbi:MAG: RdgB/HAM1 family non-canonical purine NTP pyrophosphatase [Gammaproteobacteria bacterium]|nr:RdgB/HAM1 family non-canonical purine NTP pyrophosphatase [Gammaproteobacteria bacterium]MBT8123270.1 RdgB/HAM1 family non-canonical purine NTP pyrophosphatase [Gammaproteobacteria bacterium]NNC67553.1 RdgB/HAM1 family non-canonical purine NTP pyrophosphatase [Gammaproteobacteria bacterium]
MSNNIENGKIVLASGNSGKLREIQAVLDQQRFQLIKQSELNVPDVPETGTTFVENAIIKARHAAQLTGLPALADDSGIEVDALQGAPGVYSARYAGEHGADEANNIKLLSEMKNVAEEDRGARFQCVIVYMRHAGDPMPLICEGIWEGKILYDLAGSNGFGYDPLFFVPTHGCSSAQLDPAEKNRISHRAQALQKLISKLN